MGNPKLMPKESLVPKHGVCWVSPHWESQLWFWVDALYLDLEPEGEVYSRNMKILRFPASSSALAVMGSLC